MILLAWLACATEPEPRSCAAGTVDDGAACVPEACGTGAWGDVPVDGATIFVDASSAGGDGSEDAPFSTIAEALERVADERGGGTVVIAAGTYPEPVETTTDHGAVTLAGRCSAMVTLDGADAGRDATGILLYPRRNQTVNVSGLSVRRFQNYGVVVGGGTAELGDLVIEDNEVVGLAVSGSGVAASIDAFTVRGTAPNRGEYGYGVAVIDGAEVVLTNGWIEGNSAIGVWVSGATASIADTTVAGTLSDDAGELGAGLLAQDAEVAIERSTFASNRYAGVVVDDATVAIRDSVVSGTFPADANAEPGGGVFMFGGTLELQGGALEGNEGAGLAAFAGTTSVSGTAVIDTVEWRANGAAFGILASGTAAIAVADAVLTRNVGVGAAATGAASLTLLRVEVEGTHANAVGLYGDGVEASDDSTVVIEDCVLADNASLGLFLNDRSHATVKATDVTGNTVAGVGAADSSSLFLSDVRVTATGADTAGLYGYGVEIFEGATCAIEDSDVSGNAALGLYAGDTAVVTVERSEFATNGAAGVYVKGASVAMTETTVADTQYRPDLGQGVGIEVGLGGALACTGCVVTRNATAGVLAYEGTVSLVDSLVSDTLATDGERGFGVSAGGASEVSLIRTTIEGSRGVGVLATDDSRCTLEDVQVRDTRPTPVFIFAAGVEAWGGGVIEARGLTVESTLGIGLVAHDLGFASCDACTLRDNSFAGAGALDGALHLVGSSLEDNGDPMLGGVGLYVDSIADTTLTVTDTTFSGSPYAGIWLTGPGAYLLDGVTIADTAGLSLGTRTVMGNALYVAGGIDAWDGARGLSVDGGSFSGSVGPAVLLDGASAHFYDELALSDNGGDVWQQDCDGVTSPPPGLPRVEGLCPDTWLSTVEIVFDLILAEVEPASL